MVDFGLAVRAVEAINLDAAAPLEIGRKVDRSIGREVDRWIGR